VVSATSKSLLALVSARLLTAYTRHSGSTYAFTSAMAGQPWNALQGFSAHTSRQTLTRGHFAAVLRSRCTVDDKIGATNTCVALPTELMGRTRRRGCCCGVSRRSSRVRVWRCKCRLDLLHCGAPLFCVLGACCNVKRCRRRRQASARHRPGPRLDRRRRPLAQARPRRQDQLHLGPPRLPRRHLARLHRQALHRLEQCVGHVCAPRSARVWGLHCVTRAIARPTLRILLRTAGLRPATTDAARPRRAAARITLRRQRAAAAWWASSPAQARCASIPVGWRCCTAAGQAWGEFASQPLQFVHVLQRSGAAVRAGGTTTAVVGVGQLPARRIVATSLHRGAVGGSSGRLVAGGSEQSQHNQQHYSRQTQTAAAAGAGWMQHDHAAPRPGQRRARPSLVSSAAGVGRSVCSRSCSST